MHIIQAVSSKKNAHKIIFCFVIAAFSNAWGTSDLKWRWQQSLVSYLKLNIYKFLQHKIFIEDVNVSHRKETSNEIWQGLNTRNKREPQLPHSWLLFLSLCGGVMTLTDFYIRFHSLPREDRHRRMALKGHQEDLFASESGISFPLPFSRTVQLWL